jgi:hypothetical protein
MRIARLEAGRLRKTCDGLVMPAEDVECVSSTIQSLRIVRRQGQCAIEVDQSLLVSPLALQRICDIETDIGILGPLRRRTLEVHDSFVETLQRSEHSSPGVQSPSIARSERKRSI